MNTGKIAAVIGDIFLFLGMVVYLGISAVTGNRLSTAERVFDPQKISIFNPSPEEVKITTSDAQEIAGWYLASQKSDKAIILVHGLNSSRTLEFAGKFPEFGSEMNRQGFSILMIVCVAMDKVLSHGSPLALQKEGT